MLSILFLLFGVAQCCSLTKVSWFLNSGAKTGFAITNDYSDSAVEFCDIPSAKMVYSYDFETTNSTKIHCYNDMLRLLDTNTVPMLLFYDSSPTDSLINHISLLYLTADGDFTVKKHEVYTLGEWYNHNYAIKMHIPDLSKETTFVYILHDDCVSSIQIKFSQCLTDKECRNRYEQRINEDEDEDVVKPSFATAKTTHGFDDDEVAVIKIVKVRERNNIDLR